MGRWCRGGFVCGNYHAHCICGTEDFVVRGKEVWGEHLQAGEVTAMGDFELDEGISDLDRLYVSYLLFSCCQ